MNEPSRLLDLPPFPSDGYAELADRVAALLHTRSNVLLVQGEAIVALEATATSLAQPGLRALNIVTSPYGAWFGSWLRRGGAEVVDLVARAGGPITEASVADAFDGATFDIVALVHAESATGILNPLSAIARQARDRGALLVVDAVASIGGHILNVDALDIDIAVIGPQKALGGSAGVSMLSVSERAWTLIDRPDAPRSSILSLGDHRALWLRTGRGALPGTPSSLEFWALRAALDRVEAEGLDAILRRHADAAAAARRGLRALGLQPFVPDAAASHLVTGIRLPDGITTAQIPLVSGLSPAVGIVDDNVLRLNHTGPNATLDAVLAGIATLGEALAAHGQGGDVAAARAAVLASAPEPAGIDDARS